MKWFHNANAAKWLAFVFALAIEILLGVNAFFLVNTSTEVALAGFPGLALVISALFGLGLFVGGMWVFLYAEYSFKAARAYTTYHHTVPWREVIVFALIGGVIALDLTSLAFRKSYLSNRGADWLFWFFVILAILPPLIGVIVHVFVNKPVEFRYVETYNRLHQQTLDELESIAPGMSLDRKLRFLNGEGDALSEHLQDHNSKINQVKDIKERERIATADKKAREREEAAKKASPMQQLIGSFRKKSTSDPADTTSSSNGNRHF